MPSPKSFLLPPIGEVIPTQPPPTKFTPSPSLAKGDLQDPNLLAANGPVGTFDPAAQLGWSPPQRTQGPLNLSPEATDAAIAALSKPQSTPIALGTTGRNPTATESAQLGIKPPPSLVAAKAPVPPVVAAAQQVVAAKKGGGGAGKPAGPTPREEIVSSMRAMGDADQAMFRAQATEQSMMADLLDQQRDAAEQRMVERDARRAQRDQILQQQVGKLEEATEAASRVSFDSGRLFSNPGGVLMAIGAALGGGAAARVTGRNEGMAALNAALDRDFQEQKANADVKEGAVRNRSNLVTQMRGIFEDQTQADLAAEIAHKEAAAQQIAALGARSKVPEIQAAAQKAAAEVSGNVAKLREQWRASAAAAAAAAEEKMWNRAFKLRELQLKELEARGKAGEKIEEGAQRIANQVQSAKIPAAEAQAKRARASLQGATALNTNPVSSSFAQAFPLAYKLLAGDEAAASQQDFAGFKSAALNALSGAAVSEQEYARISQALENAGTPADRRRAIENALEALNNARANIYAGERPESVQRYQERLQQQAPTQSDIPGFEPGIR